MLLLLVRSSPLRAQLLRRPASPDEPAALLFDGVVESAAAAFADVVAGLDVELDRLVCYGPEPIRQHLIPQLVREELAIPPLLLNYYDLRKVSSSSPLEPSASDDFEHEASQMTSRLDALSEGLSLSHCCLISSPFNCSTFFEVTLCRNVVHSFLLLSLIL